MLKLRGARLSQSEGPEAIPGSGAAIGNQEAASQGAAKIAGSSVVPPNATDKTANADKRTMAKTGNARLDQLRRLCAGVVWMLDPIQSRDNRTMLISSLWTWN